ncbi:Aldo/keto reductase [Dacryopinax primogenitus]|uniref:Aldo/keto reductase n=1 Tax=Dacryopinax primogenitus (strain DJM 731) TaxID=1858805 RepID=M5FZ79_DACPD|nr:Aldo/keto reductase [Dacryopinax primogenitus]EJT96802.1 Aldo/keto reductase [Dacryopinax primogenitus]
MSIPIFKLLDGHTIPQLAFGTGTALYQQNVTQPVLAAIKAAYTHIDGAQVYGNEDSVGDAIVQSGVPREQLFVTTKVVKLGEGETIPESLKGSLKKLKTDYVDLFLIHSPTGFEAPGRLEEVWKGMEEVKDAGLAKSIGVSNFRIKDFERVLKIAKYKPVVNQIELHPYVYKQLLPLLKFQSEHGILTESFGGLTPVTKKTDGPVTPVLSELANKLGGTETQVLMKWLEQKGIIAVTTTRTAARLQEYLDVYKLPNLSEADIKAIDDAGAKLHSRHFARHMDEL